MWSFPHLNQIGLGDEQNTRDIPSVDFVLKIRRKVRVEQCQNPNLMGLFCPPTLENFGIKSCKIRAFDSVM